MKIKHKISIGFGSLSLIILLALGIVIYRVSEKEINKKVEEELSNMATLCSEIIETSVNSSIKSYLISIAEKTESLVDFYYRQFREGKISEEDALDRARKIILDKKYGKIGDTGYLAGVNTRGVLTIHPYSQGVDASGHEFMQKAVKMKSGYLEYMWKNVNEEKERAKAGALKYFAPWDLIIWASSYKSEFIRLVDMEELKNMISGITLGKTGSIFVLSGDGTLIIHPSMEGNNVKDLQDTNGKYFIKEMLEKKNGKTVYYWKGEGSEEVRKKIAYLKYLPEMNWIVAADTYVDEYHTSLKKIRNIIISAIIFSFVFTNILVSFLLSGILRPMKLMKKMVDRVSSGNLVGEISIKSKDEIGTMSGHFNTLLSNFREFLMKIKESTRVLRDSTQDLSSTSKEIATTSNQQAVAVKEIVSTMEDSDRLSKVVAQKINEVANIAGSTKENVEKGFGYIQSNMEKMQEIKQTNGETIQGIKSLGEQIESIWEIVNIINGIADQTKIIAFNAELEASKAGEAGKDFQIVANEIRRLVDNTVASTAEIKAKITEIQRSSDSLIMASERGTGKIKEGWELFTNLRKVFEDILSSSEVSATSAGDIATMINQQVSAFEQILLTLKQISEGIDNFVESTKSTSGASESLKDMTENLETIVGRYTVE